LDEAFGRVSQAVQHDRLLGTRPQRFKPSQLWAMSHTVRTSCRKRLPGTVNPSTHCVRSAIFEVRVELPADKMFEVKKGR
jgi:hypothetical protein